MKKFVYSLFVLFLTSNSFAQSLAFDVVGFDPAYCRINSFQNGNAVVYASATGGTTPYNYLWKNLTSLNTWSNATWGALNPGDYEIKIWDANNDTISQVISVDSLNPIAAIGVVPGPLSGSAPYYSGNAPANVTFTNESQYFANPNNPNSDTLFFWRMTQFDSYYVVQDLSNQSYTYNYGGTWAVSLVAVNKNGCTDTASVYITLEGPAGLTDLDKEIILISNPSQNQLVIQSTISLDQHAIRVYDLSGKLFETAILNGNTNTLPFNQSGIYLFEIIDAHSDVIHTGKFNF